jgi:hypothetical protein
MCAGELRRDRYNASVRSSEMHMRVATASICGAAVLLSACGGSGKSSSATTCEPPQDVGSKTSATKPTMTALLTNVAVTPDSCVDRVEFTFRPTHDGTGAPGYRVSYLAADKALVEDGSGSPVAVKGSAYLVVRFEPAATGDLSGPELVRTYTGARRIAAPENAHSVRELVKSGDFEAVLTWVVGVDGQRPFDVTASGSRVVVTIG